MGPDNDPSRYEAHLLAACAYAQLVPGEEQWFADEETCAIADRYGGGGIGLNGGSGRAAVVNGYLVKGVGRTPLVSALTDPAHASGGAYLEESVREAILAEVVRSEFPHAAIPILAIIDTGLVQPWDAAFGPNKERRVLLVRPCFLRPAHFERAAPFYSGDPREGQKDRQRVEHLFATAMGRFGQPELEALYRDFWKKWARQLGYAFVHRMPHGSNTTSNICIDGKLLDFGAMSAVPSWENIATMRSYQPLAAQRQIIAKAIDSLGYFFGRYVDARWGDERGRAQLAAQADYVFRETVAVEWLRLCGLHRRRAIDLLRGAFGERAWQAIFEAIRRFQHEYVDMLESVPDTATAPDSTAVWAELPAAPWRELRSVLARALSPQERYLAEQRSRLLCAPRQTLFKTDFKPRIYREIDNVSAGQQTDRSRVTRFIDREIARARRDADFPDASGICIGFAIGSGVSYALVRHGADQALFAVEEAFLRGEHDDRKTLLAVRVRHCGQAMLEFEQAHVAPFRGAVEMRE
jgi:hypothetical protein